MKANGVVGFRPKPENQKRLELAEQLGLNISEVVNESLSEAFDRILQRKAKKIREAIEQVPA